MGQVGELGEGGMRLILYYINIHVFTGLLPSDGERVGRTQSKQGWAGAGRQAERAAETCW